MTYEELQAEQAAWAAERFGAERSAKKALEPFAGVVEELGELDEANLRGDRDGIEDAIGDAVIYLCDVCTRMGWAMPGIRSLAIPCNSELSYLGRLAHSVLKTAQGIRKGEDHDAVGHEAVYWLLDDLDNVAAHWQLGSALKCATATWRNVVSKRDAGHDAIPEVTP